MFKINLNKLSSIASYVGILGAILVSLDFSFWANFVWVISNPILFVHMHKLGQRSQRNMFMVFLLISLFGVYNLW